MTRPFRSHSNLADIGTIDISRTIRKILDTGGTLGVHIVTESGSYFFTAASTTRASLDSDTDTIEVTMHRMKREVFGSECDMHPINKIMEIPRHISFGLELSPGEQITHLFISNTSTEESTR